MVVFYLSGTLVSLIFAVIAGFHVYWAGGGSAGLALVIPQKGPGENGPLFAPGIVATLLVAAIFLVGCLVTVTLLLLPEVRHWQWGVLTAPRVFMGLAAVFVLRALGDFQYVGFSKRIRGTQFAHWDDRMFSPLCLLIAACMLLFAWNMT